MDVVLPFWMRQRQVKAEPAGAETLRLITPNLPSHEIALRQTPSSAWSAALYRLPRENGDKELIAETQEFSQPIPAREAAFELFRRYVVT